MSDIGQSPASVPAPVPAVAAAAPFSDRLLARGLRARLALARAGAPACAATLLCVAGLAGWAWLLPQRSAQSRVMASPVSAAAPSTLVSAPPAPSSDQNLAGFYATLGERKYAEQQVKILFHLADKAHLVLSQGEYKSAYDKASHVTTYQVTLPVKGAYQAIWRFAMTALREMPFAALDEVSFRRDSIADAAVEARVRLTLYLADSADAATTTANSTGAAATSATSTTPQGKP